MKHVKRFAALCMSLMLIVSGFAAGTILADEESTESTVHYLGFASDLHATTGTLEAAFGYFPANVEYASLIGDMVGSRGGDAPAFNSSEILSRIQSVSTCQSITAANASIVWADHDAGVTDDAGIMKGMGDPAGYTSGQIYEGLNDDGSTAYYIYVVGFYHMLKGSDVSKSAASAFKSWVTDKDVTIPIIVLCHAPLVAKRGDNFGATYWNEALNYAATGVEGITTEDQTDIPLIRNVFYFSGHNHTVDANEYVYSVGSVMSVQIDTTSSLQAGDDINYTEAYDEEIADLEEDDTGEDGDDPSLQAPGRSNVSAQGKNSVVYYTALTPGYLKTSGSATLMAIGEDTITLDKYNASGETNLGVTADGSSVGSPLTIDRIAWDEPVYTWSDDNSTVTATRALVDNPDYQESETVSVTTEVTKDATCTDNGETTYTAVFTNPAFEIQTKTLEDIDALGHDYEDPTYTWSADNSEVTAKRVCKHDATHVETETVATTSEVTQESSVTEEGEKVYMAVFTNAAFTQQTKSESIPKLEPEESSKESSESESEPEKEESKDSVKPAPSKTNNSGGTTKQTTTNSPKTGDNTNARLWALIMTLAAVLLAAAAIYRWKIRKNS